MDQKTLRKITYLIFGLVVIIGIMATIFTFVVVRRGNFEVLKISGIIFMWARNIIALALIGVLVVNIVMLSGMDGGGKERRFVVISLITFIGFVLFKIGIGFGIQFLIRAGGINGLSLHQVVGVANGIGAILGALIFLLSAIVYIAGGVISTQKRDSGKEGN